MDRILRLYKMLNTVHLTWVEMEIIKSKLVLVRILSSGNEGALNPFDHTCILRFGNQ